MTDLLFARHILQAEKIGFVLVRDGREIARGSASSTHERLAALDRLGNRARGASLADKVVRKAVPLIGRLCRHRRGRPRAHEPVCRAGANA